MKRLLISLALLVAGLFLAEFSLSFADADRALTEAWKIEDGRIDHANELKLSATTWQRPIWSTPGHPLGPKAPGTARVLVIGDSYVWGDGYANLNETWPQQLQQALRRAGRPAVEVVAIGMRGASTEDQLTWLRDEALMAELDADVAVLGFLLNDLAVDRPDGSNLVHQLSGPVQDYLRSPWLDGFSWALPRIVETLQDRYTRRVAADLPESDRHLGGNDWHRALLSGRNFELYSEVVAGVARRVDELDLPLVVVTLPSRDAELHEPLHAPVKELFERNGLVMVDLIDAFRERLTDEAEDHGLWVNPADAHPGPQLTRFYAEEVSALLLKSQGSRLGPAGEGRLREPRITDWMPASLQLSQRGRRLILSFPAKGDDWPQLPLQERHLVLSFESPVRIEAIHLEAGSLGPVGARVHDDEGRVSELRVAKLDDLRGLLVGSLRLAPSSEGPGELILEIAGSVP